MAYCCMAAVTSCYQCMTKPRTNLDESLYRRNVGFMSPERLVHYSCVEIDACNYGYVVGRILIIKYIDISCAAVSKYEH
jgi:hypothetical protein